MGRAFQRTEDCPRFGKWIGGCNWEPRYDRAPLSGDVWGLWTAEELSAMRRETYVRDVCTRCGKTIERGPVSIPIEGSVK